MAYSDPTYWYLTEEDYRDSTTVPTLLPKTSEGVDSLLIETMILIDSYVGRGYTPYDEDQEFVFPRITDVDSDEEPQIPRSVHIATRIVADAILQRRSSGVLKHEVLSESNLGHSYTKKQTAMQDFGYEQFPPEAIALLQQYRNFGGQLALSDDVE